MKKFKFLGMAAIAAMAVSCSSDDVVSAVQDDNAIQFGTYVGKAAISRGTVATIENVEDGFGVYAYYTDTTAFASYTGTTPNFMNNEKVYSEDGGRTWKYDITKYWPNNNDEMVSFFAYAPYDAAYQTSANGKVTYQVPADVKEQIDLLWSRSNTTDLKKQAVDGVVTFNFAHALARVGVTVSCAIDAANAPATGAIADGTTIKVNKIVFSSKNNVTTAGPAPEPTEGAFYTEGVIDMNATSDVAYGNSIWSDETGAQTITLTADNFKGDLTFDKVDNAKDENADDSYMMIIPQDFSTGGLYVWVDYTVTTTDAKLDGGKSVIENKISQAVPVGFLQGKAYTLNLVLGMTSVKVEAAIDPWELVDAAQVNVPANK